MMRLTQPTTIIMDYEHMSANKRCAVHLASSVCARTSAEEAMHWIQDTGIATELSLDR